MTNSLHFHGVYSDIFNCILHPTRGVHCEVRESVTAVDVNVVKTCIVEGDQHVLVDIRELCVLQAR